MFKIEDIVRVAKMLGVKFDRFSLEDLVTGIQIELEHGTISPNTNVTNDDLVLTMKIALAHLNEFSDYYNKDYGLPAWEKFLRNRKLSNELNKNHWFNN